MKSFRPTSMKNLMEKKFTPEEEKKLRAKSHRIKLENFKMCGIKYDPKLDFDLVGNA